jgi:hypothetical protein
VKPKKPNRTKTGKKPSQTEKPRQTGRFEPVFILKNRTETGRFEPVTLIKVCLLLL